MRPWGWLPLLLVLLWAALLPVQARAQNVLIISTLEAVPSAPDILSVKSSMQAEFPGADYVAGAHLAGAVTAATFSSKHYDLVLLAVINPGLEAGNLAAINTAIQTRAANAFVMMYDTGGGGGPVSGQFVSDLNTIGGLGVTVGGNLLPDLNLILNTNSVYKGSFTGLDPLGGGFAYYLNTVPPANALYLAPGGALPRLVRPHRSTTFTASSSRCLSLSVAREPAYWASPTCRFLKGVTMTTADSTIGPFRTRQERLTKTRYVPHSWV